MAVETGILSFEAVFMPFILTDNGQTLIERVSSAGLLPPPPLEDLAEQSLPAYSMPLGSRCVRVFYLGYRIHPSGCARDKLHASHGLNGATRTTPN